MILLGIVERPDPETTKRLCCFREIEQAKRKNKIASSVRTIDPYKGLKKTTDSAIYKTFILGLPKGCAAFGKSNRRRGRSKAVPSIRTTDPNRIKKILCYNCKSVKKSLPKGSQIEYLVILHRMM